MGGCELVPGIGPAGFVGHHVDNDDAAVLLGESSGFLFLPDVFAGGGVVHYPPTIACKAFWPPPMSA